MVCVSCLPYDLLMTGLRRREARTEDYMGTFLLIPICESFLGLIVFFIPWFSDTFYCFFQRSVNWMFALCYNELSTVILSTNLNHVS